MPIHHIKKNAKANTEKLPDVTGVNITYAGGTECTIEVTERVTTEPTVTAGADGSAGGYSGVITDMTATILPQYKLGGAIVWETVTVIAPEGDSC